MTISKINPIVLVGVVLSPASLLAEQEQLLSRNATYRVIGEGYVYTGQVQPGTNLRPKKARWMPTPLVEQTDTGDLLIDGKTDHKSMVYTPWFWTSQAKRITVEMTLPGPSKVRRVRVHLPTKAGYQPESVSLSLQAPNGRWHKVAQPTVGSPDRTPSTWTFRMPGVHCRRLKVVVVEGDKPHIGITEIEVYGDGPNESTKRGLTRSKPHIETIEQPQPHMAAGSVLLTSPGKTAIELSGDGLTAGNGTMLVDGDRATAVRVDMRTLLLPAWVTLASAASPGAGR